MDHASVYIQNNINEMSQEIRATLNELINIIHNLRTNPFITINRLAFQFMESIRIIITEPQQTNALLRNSFLAMIIAFALSCLLYYANFSPFLRMTIWTIYGSLCFHMLITFIRHSQRQISPYSYNQDIVGYRNDHLVRKIIQSKIPTDIELLGEILNDNDMKIIVNQAINKQKCRSLKLIDNQLTSISASILADAFIHNNTLQRLFLWNNQIGDEGVQALSNALSSNTNSLKQLDLSQNQITDLGAQYLAQMLQTNSLLTHLTLSNNQITDHGIHVLTHVLQHRNRTLQVLTLTQNQLITDKSIQSMIDMFKTNRSIRKLWIDHCHLSKNAREKLRRAKPTYCELYT